MQRAPSPRRQVRWFTSAIITAAAVTLTNAQAQAQAPTVIPGHRQQLQVNAHGLGLCGGYPGATGFAYRRYIGDGFIQANLLPLVADRGDFLAIMFGVQVGHYLLVWQQGSSLGVLPATSALRVVGVASTFFSRDAQFADAIASPVCTGPTCAPTASSPGATVDNTSGLGAGIGFEFGAIRSQGFSFSLDLMLTATWDQMGFDWLVPLPYGSIMYSW